MFVYKTRIRNFAAIIAAGMLVAASGGVAAGAAKVRIKNFGQVDANFYRGAQPETRDYADLAALGVKTVIDLTRGGREDEPVLVHRAGMKFYRIPLSTSERPPADLVGQFLQIVNNPANLPVYVHCQGGRHRTGAMTAVYRITKDGWTADHAYQEMKLYHFEGFPGHPALKQFVFDYYSQLKPAPLVQKVDMKVPAEAAK